MAFVLILAVLIILVGRTSFFIRDSMGWLCPEPARSGAEESVGTTLDIGDPCHATGIPLVKGNTYRFEVVASKPTGIDNLLHGGQRTEKAPWTDGGSAATADGLVKPVSWIFHAFLPLRRNLSQPWLKLMGRIDNAGVEEFAIGDGTSHYTARSSGELYLYVNDAVFGFAPGRYWAWPYFWDSGKNLGRADVKVTAVETKRVE